MLSASQRRATASHGSEPYVISSSHENARHPLCIGFDRSTPAKSSPHASTRALAIEWEKDNIRVNAVAPAWVRTGFIAPVLAKPELVGAIEAVTPMGRLVEPEEVAAAILFLASPAAAMTTGHVLAVDGGYLAQ